ncbi:permease [Lusitaniella coriacea LEGE 07157]|uniref:Permease n=1 Tax=Lusitaniella coriacea LEGE 07157 TaxID=945747 RepID=A0A8J7JEB4_9CYAN|nr:permease [Lusitaniella coriacea]MBE9118765.1 permease [Lusitaniella coriacea LEGE 07157]
MNQLYNSFTLFLSLLVEAIPFLLLGVLLSSALLFFVDERKLMAYLPRNPFFGAVVGSCVGFLFPVCECGNVPVARRLLTQGAPTSVAIGFLLAAPTINPVVIWSTWVAFQDVQVVVLRVVFSLIIAVVAGSLFSVQKDPRPMLQPELAQRVLVVRELDKKAKARKAPAPEVPTLLQSGTFLLGRGDSPIRLEEAAFNPNEKKPQWREKFSLFLNTAVQELRELGGMLILGSAIAAAIQVLAPRELVLSLGHGPITSILAMILLAAIVSICSTVDAFFVLAFASTFTTGSLLAFMVFGPTIDIKAIGLLLSIFKPRMVLYLFAIAAQLTIILTLSYSYFF